MGTFCKANQEALMGFRIKLYPTEQQKIILNEQIDLFRYVYNWALETEHNYYHNSSDKHFLREREMYDRFKELRNDPSMEWLRKLPLNTGRHAILKLIQAFKDFFSKYNRYPKFKSKRNSDGKYFAVRGERVHFYEDSVHIEGFKRGDNLLCKNHHMPRGNRKFYNCVISFDGIDYWLSLTMELYEPMSFRERPSEGLGIDLGLRKLAKLSNGDEYHLPNTSKLEIRKKRFQRKVSKDNKRRFEEASQTRTKFDDIQPSKNAEKRASKYKKICRKITNIRKTFIHTMTTEIVNLNPEYIVMETLNVRGMMKNKYLAKFISESNFYSISEQLEYKCKRKEIPFIKADISFPSTQLCSNCGNRYKVGKSEIYTCPCCGLTIDRDLNAAINLKNYYHSTV